MQIIPSFCFTDCLSITSLVLPSNISIIDDYAFAGCSGLSGELSIPNSITKLGDSSFFRCFTITSVRLPMDEITLMTRIVEYGPYCFGSCSEIQGSLFVEAKCLRDGAFHGCKGLTSVSISSYSIGYEAFYGCSNLISVNIYEGEEICLDAFRECIALKHLTMTGIKRIEKSAFQSCFNLVNELEFPDVLEYIGDCAFKNCRSLTGSIIFPSSLKYLGNFAFSGCVSLDGFLKMDTTQLTKIGDYSFFRSQMVGSLSFPPTLITIGVCAFSGCHFSGSLVLPIQMTEIPDYAFYNCNFFTGNLEIGSNIISIGSHSFSQCTGFNGNILFNSPNLKIIKHSAFFGCQNFQGTLKFPDSIEIIEDFAFFGCSSLTGELELPKSLTYIGKSAFAECYGFEGQLTISKKIQFIGENCFFRCTGFSQVYFDDKNINIEDKAFGSSHLICLNNVPKNCTVSSMGGNRCYDSDNFGRLGVITSLNENCFAHYFVNILLDIILAIGGSTIAGFLLTNFLVVVKILTSEKKRLNLIIRSIIKDEVQKMNETSEDPSEVSIRITNSIKSRLIDEIDANQGIKFSKDTIQEMIEDAMEKEWEIAPKRCNEYITSKSLEEISFPKPKDCCCHLCDFYSGDCSFKCKKGRTFCCGECGKRFFVHSNNEKGNVNTINENDNANPINEKEYTSDGDPITAF